MYGEARKGGRELPGKDLFLFEQHEASPLFPAANADRYPLINV